MYHYSIPPPEYVQYNYNNNRSISTLHYTYYKPPSYASRTTSPKSAKRHLIPGSFPKEGESTAAGRLCNMYPYSIPSPEYVQYNYNNNRSISTSPYTYYIPPSYASRTTSPNSAKRHLIPGSFPKAGKSIAVGLNLPKSWCRKVEDRGQYESPEYQRRESSNSTVLSTAYTDRNYSTFSRHQDEGYYSLSGPSAMSQQSVYASSLMVFFILTCPSTDRSPNPISWIPVLTKRTTVTKLGRKLFSEAMPAQDTVIRKEIMILKGTVPHNPPTRLNTSRI
ncbi:hypothetical protein MMC28_001125 [Mycoblastus sanguinarius]|nr:hypothetical protein [Mycoblastus sanguinarius]